ncbi:polysaccharide deacetylase family protein [Paenibacillus contaminans]|uniref:polysaccharide deacetylase family protein n=1 Tax=Paenibacillus contaminans TaxID=450362 RepID=UPI001EE0F79C|nr:polysaccharide deacetylase family protein [Paenibacillus contaminans]
MKDKFVAGSVLAVVLLGMIAVSHAAFDKAPSAGAEIALSPIAVEFGTGVYFTAQQSANAAVPEASYREEPDEAASAAASAVDAAAAPGYSEGASTPGEGTAASGEMPSDEAAAVQEQEAPPLEQPQSQTGASEQDAEAKASSAALAAAVKKPSTVTAATYKGRKISIPVLNYHSVDYDPGNIVVITPEKLDEQMAFLSENGYNPLTLDDFFLILEGGLEPPEKPVLLTFDDGYADNYKYAMPIMTKYGFHATMFMSPGTIGQDWYVNWEQAKEMKEAGWDIQPHGMTHPHLPKLSAEEQANEIIEARKQIEEHLGGTADVFCYPYGEYNGDTLRILEENDFRFAFTIQQGRTDSSQHKFQLKRIYVNGEESFKTWKQRLTGK